MRIEAHSAVEPVDIEFPTGTLHFDVSMTDADIERISAKIGDAVSEGRALLSSIDRGDDAATNRQMTKLFKRVIAAFVGKDGYKQIVNAIGTEPDNCNWAMKQIYAGFLDLLYQHTEAPALDDMNATIIKRYDAESIADNI